MKVEIPATETVNGKKQNCSIIMETDDQAIGAPANTKYRTKLATHESVFEVNAIDLIKALEYLLKCATR